MNRRSCSRRNDWRTPDDFFVALHAEFSFTVDAAAQRHNSKLPRFYADGKTADWHNERIWCNPPFDETAWWVERGFRAAQNNNSLVVMLVPLSLAVWWHRYAMNAAEIRFIEGRLTFIGAPRPAPFDCCLLIFRPNHTGRPVVSSYPRSGDYAFTMRLCPK